MPKTASRFYPNISKAVFLLLDFNKALLLTWSWGRGWLFFFFFLAWAGEEGGAIRGHTGGEQGGREGKGRRGGSLFFSFLSWLEERKEGSQSEAEELEPSEERWMAGGGTSARALLIGRLRFSPWMD